MVCSKIFSGDLPELTEEIIQYFRKDISTFKLNEDVKTKLYEYGVNNNLISSNTLLFNYPSFIKYLNIDKILSSIRTWVDTVVGKNQGKLVNLIYKSLLEIFIENEGNLYSFEVDLSTSYSYYFNNIDLILQNPNLTYNIRNLTFRIHDYDPQNIIKLLKFLYSNCNSILSMVLNFPLYDIIRDRPLIEKCLTQIINSQHNLKKISFDLGTTLYNPFLSLKNSNCSNTLNIIIFYYIDFKDIISILQEVFDQLNVLESIHILYCRSLNSDFVQQIIKVNKPFKLRSLFMSEILHVESLQLLLEKFGDYLENFGFEYMSNEYNEPKRQLFKSIMEYCTKIRYFDSGKPYDNNIYLFIKNNQHNINYLTIGLDFIHSNYTDLSSILQNLGQVLPPKLEYLNLYLSFNNTSDLGIFLKNSQNTFIKELLIVFRYDISENILFYIKEYIMKKERVKYLAIISDDDDYELFSLKDEVNEFKLYNITVKKFSDLHFSSYSFINNFDE
ncbi:hypothetical protein GLOIN_2v1774306 [Rhizophagus irregularis DAOM 181602=DAOM 197198]|nr:hypothetical protein GLOIN_2v1774306 [Rhizophagus irregularis DAOM 181602=DAOM 197198]